jgi:hypothetical protein
MHREYQSGRYTFIDLALGNGPPFLAASDQLTAGASGRRSGRYPPAGRPARSAGRRWARKRHRCSGSIDRSRACASSRRRYASFSSSAFTAAGLDDVGPSPAKRPSRDWPVPSPAEPRSAATLDATQWSGVRPRGALAETTRTAGMADCQRGGSNGTGAADEDAGRTTLAPEVRRGGPPGGRGGTTAEGRQGTGSVAVRRGRVRAFVALGSLGHRRRACNPTPIATGDHRPGTGRGRSVTGRPPRGCRR